MSNVKKILSVIIVLGVVLLIGGSVFYLSIKDDIRYTAKSTYEKFVIKNVAAGQLRLEGPRSFRFAVKDGASVYDAVSAMDEYLYSVDEAGNRSTGDTGCYLLHKNNTYLLVKDSLGGDYSVREPVLDEIYFPFTGLINEVKPTPWTETFIWNQLAGINTFEDLVEFYKGIDPNLYRVNEETKTILVKRISSGTDDPFVAQISVKGDGVEVNYSNNIVDKEL